MNDVDKEAIQLRFRMDLADRRIVYISNEIDYNDVVYISQAITWMNARSSSEQITVRINSDGGSTFAGLDIYDIIRNSHAPTMGIVMGRADSSASLILQGCTRRCALEHSTLFLHRVETELRFRERVSAGDKFDSKKQEKRMRRLLKNGMLYEAMFEKIYARRSRQSIDKIRSLVAGSGTHLNARKARSLGFIDEILNDG